MSLSAHRRLADHGVQNDAKPHAHNDFSTQIQFTPSPTLLPLSRQSPQEFCSSSHKADTAPPQDSYCSSLEALEAPDTDPTCTQTLWNEVALFKNSHYPSNALDVNMISSYSSACVSTKDYDPQGFSSTTFVKLLEQYQITIREDILVPTNLANTSFWAWLRNAAEGALVEETLQLENCWVSKDSNNERKAEIGELATRFKDLLRDPDSAQMERQLFVTGKILHYCDLPGARVYNNPNMLDVVTEPYHLPPLRELLASSSTLTQSAAGEQAAYGTIQPVKLGSATTRTAKSSGIAQSQTAARNAAQPVKIHSPKFVGLNLPKDNVDCAYWLEASKFQPFGSWIARRTFVSNGTRQKTSPYLSISFENSQCPSYAEKRLSAKHKIAVYGSTALYNRHLLHIKASKITRNSSCCCIMQVERSACQIHFGLTIVDKEATLYVFQCKEENARAGKQDSAITWHGCSMSVVGEWYLTAPEDLVDMLDHLQIVAAWARRVYVPALQDDLTHLFNSLDR